MSTPNARLQRRLAWARWTFGVIAAITIAVFISVAIFRDQAVAGCVRNGDSKIIDAHTIEKAASNADTDAEAAGYIDEALKKRATIPMPDGWKGDPHQRGDDPKDRAEGCDHAYPNLIQLVFS